MSDEQAQQVQQAQPGRHPLKPSSSNFLNHGIIGQSRTGSALSEGLGSDGAGGGRPPKDKIRIRIQQRSSRLLSLLGLRNQGAFMVYTKSASIADIFVPKLPNQPTHLILRVTPRKLKKLSTKKLPIIASLAFKPQDHRHPAA